MVDLDKARERIAEQLAHLLRRTDGIQRDMRRESNPLAADWDEQAAIRANDEVLDAFAVVGEPHEIAPGLKARYGDVVDRISFYAPGQGDITAYRSVMDELKAG